MNTAQLIKQIWIGKSCRIWRNTMDYKLTQVAEETGFSIPTISAFEHGTNDNMLILMWYIEHGFNTEKDFVEPIDQRKVGAQEFNQRCEEYHAYISKNALGGR